MVKRGAEKILKYTDCTVEIECMWTGNTEVIPVIIVATGTISKSVRQYVSNIQGKGEINTLRTGSNKLFKRPLAGFLTILAL